MNIALALYSLSAVGGGERLALDMYRALRDLGHEVDYIQLILMRGPGRS